MSHIVTVQTKVYDIHAVAAACALMKLPAPVTGTVRLFSGEATGLIVRLPDWTYPVVIDTQSGTIQYDNFEGRWGANEQLDRFLQSYAVERAKIEARKKGYSVREQQLQDGSIKLQITAST